MSTKGVRNFRPKIHFTPPKGWTNDPNGLVYHDNKYHLFYQHYPHGGYWGPMHWGHAVSTDLIKWEHLPIAIYPDEDGGMIFSGSAVSDTENVSGLGKDGKVPLIAFYTRHAARRAGEEQSIAYSLDGVNFIKYEKNPVIPNPGLPDFRDPKMFWNPVRKCWSMTLAATDKVFFYASKDLLSWEKTGEFGTATDGNHAQGVWECTDMVPLEYKGKTIWLLIGSMTRVEGEYVGTQYFLGDFDGDKFINPIPFGYAERLDSGWDNYAGVTYNNADRPIFVGWGTNWSYAHMTPTGEYCGNMTLPRSLAIEETSVGPRLASFPIGLDSIIDSGKNIKSGDALDSETFLLKVKGNGATRISLTNGMGQTLCFGVDEENNLFVDRTNAGAKDFSEDFASPEWGTSKAKRFYDGSYELDFVFDVSVSELFSDKGTRSMAMVCYPDTPYSVISVHGDAEVKMFNVK